MLAVLIAVLAAIVTYVEGSEQYCYSCSSDSVLCRQSVYDGKYLAAHRCKSKCFLRTEDYGYKKEKRFFRGCFDGWLGGSVKYNYKGCRIQNYLGRQVEWCFCSGNFCNGASRAELTVSQGGEHLSKKYHFNPPSYLNMKKNANPTNTLPDESYQTYDYKTKHKSTQTYQGNTKLTKHTLPTDSAYTIIPHEVCRGQTSGTFHDPDDCAGFYTCANGIPYRMKCAAGTVWYDEMKSCISSGRLERPCEPYDSEARYSTQPDVRYETHSSRHQQKHYTEGTKHYTGNVLNRRK